MSRKEILIGLMPIASGITLEAINLYNKDNNSLSLDKKYIQQKVFDNQPLFSGSDSYALVTYMYDYLSVKSLNDLINFARANCNNGVDSPSQLWFSGIPLYDSKGNLEKFIPQRAYCQTPKSQDLYKPWSGNNDITVNGLVAQVMEVSRGMTNTLQDPSPWVSQEYPETSYAYELEPGKATLLNSEIAFETSPSIEILSKDDFQKAIVSELKKNGICRITPQTIADKTVSAGENTYFRKDNDGNGWSLNICQREVLPNTEVTPMNDLPIKAFPNDVRSQFDELLQNKTVIPGQEMYIRINSQDGKQTITLFRKPSENRNGFTSTIIGYKQDQLNIANDTFQIDPGPVVSLLMCAAGLRILYNSWRRGKEVLTKTVAIDWSKIREQEKIKAKPKPEVSSNGTGRVIETKSKFNPFILDLGNKVFEITNAEDITPYLQELVNDDSIQKRIKRSKEDFVDFFSVLSYFSGNFEEIRKVLLERNRFTEINIGGDSVTVSYKIVIGSGKSEQILGYFLIDGNIDENYVQVEFWSDEPKSAFINEQRSQSAKESLVESDRETYTLEEVSSSLTEAVSALIQNESLSSAEFDETRAFCLEIARKFENNSLVKKEVVRRLSEKIKTNQIRILEGNDVRPKGSYIDHASTIAGKIFDYVTGKILTNAQEFHAFTPEAKRLIGEGVIAETGAKYWGKRTESRIQIAQIEQENKRNLKVVFTHHDH